jgi:hypothetical protein
MTAMDLTRMLLEGVGVEPAMQIIPLLFVEVMAVMDR